MSGTVRRATDDDADALQALAERAVRATFTGVVVAASVAELVAAGFVRAPVPEVVADDDVRVYVAEVDGTVAGYATVDAPDAVAVPELQVHLDPDRQGRDVGSRLLERVASDYGGRLRARVLAGDVAGNDRLADHDGFERVEVRETDVGGERQGVVVYERGG